MNRQDMFSPVRGSLWFVVLALVFVAIGAVVRQRMAEGEPANDPVLSGRSIVFAIDQVHDREGFADPPSVVSVIDVSSGSLVRTISAGFTPEALYRSVEGQVVIVDHESQDDPEGRARLIELESGQVVATLQVPDLPQPIVSASGLAELSQSGRWLFVLEVEWEPGCEGDSLACDRHSLAVFDLNNLAEMGHAQLPPACGPTLLNSDGADGVIGICSSSGTLFEVTPDLHVETLTQFMADAVDPDGSFNFRYPYPVDAGRAGDDSYYRVLQTGAFVVQRADGTRVAEGDVAPQSGVLAVFEGHRGQTALFSLWSPSSGSGVGAVAFDPLRPDAAATLAAPASNRGLYLRADGGLIALVAGDLVEVDPLTGEVGEVVVDLGGEARFLQGGG